MTFLRWILRIVAVLLAVAVAVVFAARFHDGPLGPLPGGPLAAGTLVTDPVADWSFAAEVPEIELQLASQDRSRTVWILVHEGKAYVPCALGFPPGKSWYHHAVDDGRATLRIAGKRYPVSLVKLDDEALAGSIREVAARKYARRAPGESEVWIFAVASRGDGG
jgi:hypothetical protein